MLSDCNQSWYQALAGACVVSKHKDSAGNIIYSCMEERVSLLVTDLKPAFPHYGSSKGVEIEKVI